MRCHDAPIFQKRNRQNRAAEPNGQERDDRRPATVADRDACGECGDRIGEARHRACHGKARPTVARDAERKRIGRTV